jgi:TRAP-type C4-dicarboxylate transport system permease small subunit
MILPGRAAGIAARVIDTLAIALFTAMFACVIAQVFFRYFLGSPLTWSDELGRYLLVWCSFLGWIIAARRRSHLGVSMFAERARPRLRALLALFAALSALAFAAVLVWYGTRIALRNADVETVALFFGMGVVYAIVPLAAFAVGLHALADARTAVRAFTAARTSAR